MVIHGTFTAIHVYYLTRMITNGPVNGRKYYSFDTPEPWNSKKTCKSFNNYELMHTFASNVLMNELSLMNERIMRGGITRCISVDFTPPLCLDW